MPTASRERLVTRRVTERLPGWDRPAGRPRVAVVFEVYADPLELRAVLADIERKNDDVIVNCGDLIAGQWPNEMVEQLATCGTPVVHMRGNGNRMVADAHDDLLR